jgi:iron complex outermembrane recepter protein
MSELISKNDNRATIRWKLLTGASALALTAYISPAAHAEDSGQPQVWIELGAQLSRLEDGQETFSPDFPNSPARPSIFSPSQNFERPPLYSIDEFGEISLQPKDSDWTFSASIRYGRSASRRDVHQQTYPKSAPWTKYGVALTSPLPVPPSAARFADTNARTSEHHLILDFQAGKDVGLGVFGTGGSSVVNLGVRFAQFSAKSNIALKSDPDWHFSNKYLNIPSYFNNVRFPKYQPYHSNAASLQATRSFHGVGPSLSWKASAPFAGNSKDGELSVDWGLNAALLFGRQRAKIHHQTTGAYHPKGKYTTAPRAIYNVTYHGPATPDHTRSRNVTVPNVGGFAGISFKYSEAKLSFGYRADFFFGAIDGGIDARKSENRAFYGPYASISIGLGD